MAPLLDSLGVRSASPTKNFIKGFFSSLFSRNDDQSLTPFLTPRSPAPPIHLQEPGQGTFDPRNINNRGIFALFALLGASLVLASIWFFFWAKNGGFHWRKGDWEEYKSTVLRRKGPHGKTLSGATRSTDLGGGSVVADVDRDRERGREREFLTVEVEEEEEGVGMTPVQKAKKKMRIPRGKKNSNNADADVRAYRHEKPARVGGINRAADGSYHTDFADSSTDNPSTTYSARPSSPSLPSVITTSSRFTRTRHRHRGSPARAAAAQAATAKAAAAPTTPTKKHLLHHFRRNHNSKAAHDDVPSSPPSAASHRPLRHPSPPVSAPPSTDTTPTHRHSSHRPSPRRQNMNHMNSHHNSQPRHRAAPPSTTNISDGYAGYTEPLDFESRYSATTNNNDGSEAYEIEELELESRGTKSYFHPIPALTGRNSVGGGWRAGDNNGAGGGGFRRGGGRASRRDSLSDSDGEGTMLS